MWNEVDMTCFKIPRLQAEINPGLPKYKAIVLITGPWHSVGSTRSGSGVMIGFCVNSYKYSIQSEHYTFRPLTTERSSFISLLNDNCFSVEKSFSRILRCSLWNSLSSNFERHSFISSKIPVKRITFLLTN